MNRAIIIVLLFSVFTTTVDAHSGRTDAFGGHNCNVGACAGTYHYHNGGSAPAQPVQQYIPPVIQPTALPTRNPTRIPTHFPTNTPSPTVIPTNTPTPILESTSTPIPTQVNTVKSATNKPTGFWGFILSLFGR